MCIRDSHNLINIGKAGRKRHMGIRPTVRGSVMNPNDHPHGGGEGRAPVGRPGPCTPCLLYTSKDRGCKSVNVNLKQRFQEILEDNRILEAELMSRHTTFRIGGPADFRCV